MVTISQLALRAQENCVIILYFGEEREWGRVGDCEGRDTKGGSEVEGGGGGGKDRKAEREERSGGFTRASRPAGKRTSHQICAPISASLIPLPPPPPPHPF